MFNLEKGRVVARIDGGPLDGKYVFWSRETTETSIPDLFLEYGEFQPISANVVSGDKIDRVFVSGLTGCGKSTWASNFMRNMMMLDTTLQPVVFSKLSHDDVVDELNPLRIDIMNEPLPEVEELANSVVLYDDIDSIRDKRKLKEVRDLMKDTSQVGRHDNIHTIYCNHILNDYQNTKPILNESNIIVVFPQGGNFKQLEYLLKTYLGFDKSTIEHIINSESRWVLIHKEVPLYILTEYELFMPKNKYKY
jgi:hypothetical protein